MENNKNILCIDIAKIIAIFLVVFAHLVGKFSVGQQTNQYIYLFHMPVFFIISGFLYKYTNTKNEFNKILWRLLIPYLLYQLIYLPFQVGSCIVNHNLYWLDAIRKCLFGIIIGDGYDTHFSQNVCYPCWFIISMIHIKLLFLFIKLNIKNACIISLISFVLLKILLLNSNDLLFCIDNTLYALPYFCLGYILKNIHYQPIKNIIGIINKYNVLFIIISIIILCIVHKYNGILQMNLHITEECINKSLLQAYLGGLAGSLLTILIAKIIRIQNIVTDTISKNTLFILFFHTILLFITKTMHIDSIIENSSLPAVFFILYTILLFVIMFFIIKYTINFIPVLYGKYLPEKTIGVNNV